MQVISIRKRVIGRSRVEITGIVDLFASVFGERTPNLAILS